MNISAAGINLIKEYEGVRLKSYKCPAGVWTVGVGHTSAAGAPEVKPGMTITETEALKILRNDLKKFEASIDSMVRVPLKQNQYDALCSFIFNVGAGAFQKSTLLRKLNAGDYAAVPQELMKWTKAGGKELPGLVRRRRAEAAMWRGVSDAAPVKEDARLEPDVPKPSKTMAQSKEGNAALITGGLAGVTAAGDVADRVKQAGDSLSSIWQAFLSPNVLLPLLIVVIAAFIWYWRRQRLKEDGA